MKPPLCRKKIILHKNNSPVHKSVLTMGKLRDLSYKLLEHPPYSSDLASTDFHIFPNLNSFLLVGVFSFRSRGDCSWRGGIL